MNASKMMAYASFEPGAVAPTVAMPMEQSVGTLQPPKGIGGYYWLLAREENPRRILTASSVTYFSNPGPPPRELLKTQKNELMIVPVKLPREHNQFQSGKTWEFIVRSSDGAVADTTVLFASSQGTKQSLQTDANGVFSVTFPDDFPAPGSQHGGHGMHGRLSAQFGLMTSLVDGDHETVAAFNHIYTPHPLREKSRMLALGLLIVGMALSAPMLRRRQKGA